MIRSSKGLWDGSIPVGLRLLPLLLFIRMALTPPLSSPPPPPPLWRSRSSSVHHHLIMPQLTQHDRCILGRGGGELHPCLMKLEATKGRRRRSFILHHANFPSSLVSGNWSSLSAAEGAEPAAAAAAAPGESRC